MVVLRRVSMESRFVLDLSRRCMFLCLSCRLRLVDEVRLINKRLPCLEAYLK